MSKDFITNIELANQMDLSISTIQRLVDRNELPQYSYGNHHTKKKGWHKSVLEKHSLYRYQLKG